ncbi:cytochrome P450 [Mycena crocata]|nr:cytochrome P450 [Mycena crocata]
MIPVVLSIALAPLVLVAFLTLRRKPAPLPPGPRGKPIIGNLLDVPFKNPWAVFEAWKRKYGSIVHMNIFGNSIVVLNSMETVVDLLEKRAANYSHRPVFTMAGELIGLDNAIGLNNRDKVWRHQRRLAAIALGPLGTKRYMPVHQRLAASMLSELQDRPEDFVSIFKLAATRLILEITYGLSPATMEDPQMVHTLRTLELVSESIQPGAYLVDFIPWLKHIPAWVPFLGIHATAAAGRAQVSLTVNGPFDYVKEQMEAGTAKPSLVAHLLSDRSDVEGLDFEHVVKWTAGTMYGSGTESMSLTLAGFVMVMALYPDVQKKAQEEVDLLLKGNRLPSVEDRPSLPYVNAVITETMRWHVSLPLSMPRVAEQDDIYNGYLIPKGSLILPNVRGIADEGDYLTNFSPERHLTEKSGTIDPLSYVFGFGRRACPGRLLAENSVFIFVASILATFNITKALDSAGNVIPIVPGFAPGLISHPLPFNCSIVPRSPETQQLIANQLLAETEA